MSYNGRGRAPAHSRNGHERSNGRNSCSNGNGRSHPNPRDNERIYSNGNGSVRPSHSPYQSGNSSSGSGSSHHHPNGSSNGNGSPFQSESSKSPFQGSQHGSRPTNGDKRGRDRSEESGSSRENKTMKRDEAPKGRRMREEFVDQIISRPHPNFDKRGVLTPNDTIVKLKANYFRATADIQVAITLYRVDFKPETELRGIRNRLIEQHREQFSGIYDGGNQLYLMSALPQDKTTLNSVDREGNNYEVILRRTCQILFTEGKFLQVLNVILRKAMHGLKLQLVGRNFYDASSQAIINIPQHRIQIWPGYITSIRQHEQDVMVNCEISHKVMRQENVHKIIMDCVRSGGSFKDEASRKLIGTTVLTDYNNATYRVSDIDWDQTPSSTFDTKIGPVSYISYYQKKYSLTIRDPKQPLLVVKASARNIRAGQSEIIFLVPELCRATGLTDEMRNNFQLMRDMSQYTRLTPKDRVDRLMNYNRRLYDSAESSQVLCDKGLTLDRTLVEFDGRRLEQQIIQFDNHQEELRDNADWTHALAKNKMFTVMSLENWFYVYPRQCERASRDFLDSLRNVTKGLGMTITKPVEVSLNDDRVSTYTRELESILCKDPKFIVIVVPNIRADRYAAIKAMTLCRRNPVAVQVIVQKTMQPKRGSVMSIATKVAIQINCKLGGIPWNVDLKLGGIMVVGFDVSRDTANRKNFYGAMVASLNPTNNGGHYFSAVNEHKDGTQLSEHFGLNIIAAIRRYADLNGALPKRILIFRDGVGDGDLKHVFDTEVKDIVSKIIQIDVKEDIKIGFIVVNKTTNTRLFACGGRAGYDNPLPGTVADDVVTLPERYDFFLVSQCVRQGTVSPSYYHVLKQDFSKNRPDIMQMMTYKLCHTYFNWSGTTRIPAVVQYAKKLAFLIGQYVHQIPNVTDVNQQLYFL